MKKKWWIILIMVIVISAIVVRYYYSRYQCTHYKEHHSELLAFQYDVDATCSDDVNMPGVNGNARGDSGSFAKSFTAKTGEDYRILTNTRIMTGTAGEFFSEILIDVNGDGVLSRDEFNQAAINYILTEPEKFTTEEE